MILENILGKHKQSIISTWHSPNGKIHNHIDYILIMSRFRSVINVDKTKLYNKADIGSDHDLLLCLLDNKLNLNEN